MSKLPSSSLQILGLISSPPDKVWSTESQAALDRIRTIYHRIEAEHPIGFVGSVMSQPGGALMRADVSALESLTEQRFRPGRDRTQQIESRDGVDVRIAPTLAFSIVEGDYLPLDWCPPIDGRGRLPTVAFVVEPSKDVLLDLRDDPTSTLNRALNETILPLFRNGCPAAMEVNKAGFLRINVSIYLDGIGIRTAPPRLTMPRRGPRGSNTWIGCAS